MQKTGNKCVKQDWWISIYKFEISGKVRCRMIKWNEMAFDLYKYQIQIFKMEQICIEKNFITTKLVNLTTTKITLLNHTSFRGFHLCLHEFIHLVKISAFYKWWQNKSKVKHFRFYSTWDQLCSMNESSTFHIININFLHALLRFNIYQMNKNIR